jgi:hypothetical protein
VQAHHQPIAYQLVVANPLDRGYILDAGKLSAILAARDAGCKHDEDQERAAAHRETYPAVRGFPHVPSHWLFPVRHRNARS